MYICTHLTISRTLIRLVMKKKTVFGMIIFATMMFHTLHWKREYSAACYRVPCMGLVFLTCEKNNQTMALQLEDHALWISRPWSTLFHLPQQSFTVHDSIAIV